MKGSYIDIPAADGGSLRAYRSLPEAGTGPGLVLIQEIFGVTGYMREQADLFAEEGYVVLVPDLFWRIEPGIELPYSDAGLGQAFKLYEQFDPGKAVKDVLTTATFLRDSMECTGLVGAVGFCLGGGLAHAAAGQGGLDCAVSYYGVGIEHGLDAPPKCPMVLHYGADDQHVSAEAMAAVQKAYADSPDVEVFMYPGAGHAFANPYRPEFHKTSTALAHSRTIALLRNTMGPEYDLAALWDEHCLHEFGTRDVTALMATMVDEPYVNIVPTVTGGVGGEELTRFYRDFFVNEHPADMKMISVSRTIGPDRLVDEMVYCFTHTTEIPWMLPGIPLSGRYVEVPMVAIVNFRGNKIYHEHIYWDQASVLAQVGVLDPATLPIMGVETAQKVLDETQPSNRLVPGWDQA